MALYRVEDRRLLTGRGAFLDDLPIPPGLHHAAILRSPYPHARFTVDAADALRLPGVRAVLTPEDVVRWARPFPSALPRGAPYYPLAVGKVRFVGEPVAVVVAEDRYVAEDALEAIAVRYEPLPAVVDPAEAAAPGAPLLHEELGSNVALHRHLVYGDPEAAFRGAPVVVRRRLRFPKYGSTPLETYGVVADWEPGDGRVTVWSNFQGPFSMHPVVAQALGVPSHRLRFVVPPDIGGGFGIKTSIYPYLALMALASRKAGVPVKWVEDRQEHLLASSSGTDRVYEVALAAGRDGVVTAAAMTIYDNVGAYFRPPEPGCTFRPLGNYVGPYRFRNLDVDAYIVLTNKSLTGPNRGYGCAHLYFGLERLMDELAVELGQDPVELRRRNLIPKDAFPYETPTGGLYDAGDYEACLDRLVGQAGYEALRQAQAEARREGRLVGVGIALGVDPSVSNMGYVDIAATPEERRARRPKSGATQATTIQVDDLGKVTVELSTTPQGQSHETVVRRLVAAELGIPEEEVEVVSGMDTAQRSWTIPSGSYSSRFASIGSSSAVAAARKVVAKMKAIAAYLLEVPEEEIEVRDGAFEARGVPERRIAFRHVAGVAHWDPSRLPPGMEPGIYVTHYHTMPTAKPPDDADRVNSSNTYGFMADLALVEVDRETGEIRIDRYVSVHDSGVILDRVIAEGQVRGSFVHGLGGAMYEELAYAPDGTFLTASFVDYLCPTVHEVPRLETSFVEIPSPFTLTGAKGIGESATETVPVAIANAVTDALRPYGVAIDELPVTPAKVWRRLREAGR